MDPVREPPAAVEVPTAPPPPATPSLAPSEAFRRGLMPLASTNAWAFRQNHPTYDGRGVLIGILDSGIDPGIAGLWLTSTGDRKLVDLRDFSGEGAVPLVRLATRADTATVGGRRIAGLGRIAALNATGPIFAGTFRERPLGERPASDLNGDGDDADTMILVVTKAPDGWVVFADTDGDGTLADERPIHDFLATKETFGWTIPGRPTPLTIAANFGGTDAAPTLGLFFDTSGHGSHVAGIAAGADLYGIRGFDGVAPGAQLLGLKIANNAHGGISVTGSMIRAIDYAITYARSRSLPLVLNMSFGVGNEREGAARIDAIIDSVLAANPEVVFVTSAGNDGPGLSTMGFPGSADRVISVGATLPPSFIGGTAGDVIAFFSARGGEVAKPDLLAPGIAYSSVPRWNIGDETKNGTSMASPHVAGAVALILSGVKQEKGTVTAGQIKQALVATARAMPGRLAIDQGAGLLDVVAADRLLRRLPAMAVIRARIGQEPAGGVLRIVQAPPADTTVTVTVEGVLAGPVRLVSNVGFITVPGSVQLTPPRTTFEARIVARSLTSAPIVGGIITGWATDTTIGPLFRLPVTLVRAPRVSDSGLVVKKTLGAADLLRVFFPVDSARPFRVRFSTTGRTERVLAFLHEPGGQPYRGDNGIPAGAGDQATAIELDGRDVIGGVYEAIASASPADPATANVQVDLSPVRLRGERILGDSVRIELANLAGARVLGTAMFGMIGAERGMAFGQRGSAERRIPFRVPAWGRRVVVDLVVPRAQWPAFTDFGLSIVAANGRILETAPLNYAYGRATLELPADSSIARDLEVVLTPAFADPTATALWDADLTIRVYAETPVLVDIPSGAEFSVDPRQTTRVAFPLGRFPWSLEDGFFPLGNLVVDVGGVLWGREVRLPPPAPPVMR
jgi:subtilisin family serine protease